MSRWLEKRNLVKFAPLFLSEFSPLFSLLVVAVVVVAAVVVVVAVVVAVVALLLL